MVSSVFWTRTGFQISSNFAKSHSQFHMLKSPPWADECVECQTLLMHHSAQWRSNIQANTQYKTSFWAVATLKMCICWKWLVFYGLMVSKLITELAEGHLIRLHIIKLDIWLFTASWSSGDQSYMATTLQPSSNCTLFKKIKNFFKKSTMLVINKMCSSGSLILSPKLEPKQTLCVYLGQRAKTRKL